METTSGIRHNPSWCLDTQLGIRESLIQSVAMGGGLPGKHHDLVKRTKKYKGELHGFFLDVKSWKKFKSRYNMTWQRTRFGDTFQDAVPKLRGIYAFVLEVTAPKLPPHGYILYVGITGDESADANLHKRYGQYLAHARKQDGRPAVSYMLQDWSDDLSFHYITFPDKKVDLAAMEKALINAVMPPVNKRDLEAEIAAAKAATF